MASSPSSSRSPSHYDTLRLRSDASPQQVRKAYRRLAQLYHPDRQTGEGGGEAMARINQAYQVLGDPHRRAEYDSTMRAQATARAIRAQRASAMRTGSKPWMLLWAVISLTVLVLGWVAWRTLAPRSVVMPAAATTPATVDNAPLPLIPARRIEARQPVMAEAKAMKRRVREGTLGAEKTHR